MKFKKNRHLCLVIITLIYILASIVGIAVFNALSLDLYLKLLIADVVATVVVFIFSLIFKTASVYDPYWSVQPVVIILAFAFGSQFNLTRLLVIVAITFWGIRLTANWTATFTGLDYQDWRYTMLKEKTGKAYFLVNFFGIHLFPTLVVYACILPAVYTFFIDFQPNVGVIIFYLLSIYATFLQLVSDWQMQNYRKTRPTPFMRYGLWKHCRHPNYLGEILMWWGVGLSFVCAVPSMWYLLAGALINTLMFLFISSPMAEKRLAKREGFEEYKKQTRMLFPISKNID